MTTLDAVCGSVCATSRSGREILHFETVGNLFVTCNRNEYGGKSVSP